MQPLRPPVPPQRPRRSGGGVGLIIVVGTVIVVGVIGGLVLVNGMIGRTIDSVSSRPSSRTTPAGERPTASTKPKPPAKSTRPTTAPPRTTAPPKTTAPPRTTAPPKTKAPPKKTQAPPKKTKAPPKKTKAPPRNRPAHLQPQHGYEDVPLPGSGSTLGEAAAIAQNNVVYNEKVSKSTCKKMPNLYSYPYPRLSDKRMRSGLQIMADCAAAMWKKPLAKAGYQATKVKIRTYQGQLRTPCGNAGGYGTAGFYCSGNQQIYMALGLGASRNLGGYVWGDYLHTVDHEYGHHIQARTGILNAAGWHEQVEDRQDSLQIRRRIELQANCFSGMAMKQSGKVSRSELIDWSDGRTNSNTHGSSEHYVAWTLQGHKYRNVYQCNTFRARAGDVS